MIFVDWDSRPAVMSDDTEDAVAVLAPNGPWISVNSTSVGGAGYLMSEAEWRAMFEPHFGPLDLTKIVFGPPLSNAT